MSEDHGARLAQRQPLRGVGLQRKLLVTLIGLGLIASTTGIAACAKDQDSRLLPTGADGKPLPSPRVGPPLFPDEPPLPTLSAAESDTASALAVRDSRIGRLTTNTPYSTQQPIIWTEGREQAGAVIILVLENSISIEADWPIIVDDEAAKALPEAAGRGYVQQLRHIKIDRLDSIAVFVDLRFGEVVAIRPHDFERAGDTVMP